MTLHTQGLQTLAQARAFVSGADAVSCTLEDRSKAYGWMADTLRQFGYARRPRADKGVLRQYLAKVTGLSRANAVDEVTQCQAVFAVEHISDAYLLPVPKAMMDAFPFVIRGFHSDNGRNTSIIRWLGCWRSCASSRPNRARASQVNRRIQV